MFSGISHAAAFLAMASAVALVGEAPTSTLRAQGGREHAVYVSVLDKNETPVTDLGPSDFVVREGGTSREVLRVSRATEPIDIALLVDTSAAIEPHVIHVRPALSRLIELMHRDNNIAVIGLGARPTILANYTRNLDQLEAAIGRVFPQSDAGATLMDALVETSRGLQKRERSRAAIVAVLTDGPEYGHADDTQAIKEMEKAGAAFYAVSVGRFSEISPEPLRYRLTVLSNGTRRTGGRHDNLMAPSAIPQALEKVARELSSQLTVVYSRPQSLIPPESVVVSATRPGLAVRATPARRPGGQP